MRHNKARTNQPFMGLLNYLGGRGSSAFGEGSSRHVESDVGGVTVGGVALEEEKSWEQPDPSVDNIPFTTDAPLVKNVCIWVVEAFRQYLFLPLTLAMPIGMVYTLGGSALQTTLNTLAVVFLLEIDDLLYNAVIDARYKRYARRHRFRLRWFDYYLLDAKRFVVIVTCMTAMVLLVNQHAPVWKSRFYGAFVLNRRVDLRTRHTG